MLLLIKVKIRAQPVEGKANKYLLEYLAKILGLPKSSLCLLKGEANSFKMVEIDAEEDYVTTTLSQAVL